MTDRGRFTIDQKQPISPWIFETVTGQSNVVFWMIAPEYQSLIPKFSIK